MRQYIQINENNLKRIVNENINKLLNEISDKTKAAAFVKSNNKLNDLRTKKANGERTFSRNGRMFDVDNEIQRRELQQKNFGNGLAHDLSMQYDKNASSYQKDLTASQSDVRQLKKEINDIRSGKTKERYKGELQTLETELKRSEQKMRRLGNDTHGYSVRSTTNGGYHIETPDGGSAYSDGNGNGMSYNDSNSSNVTRLGKLRDITDAMTGYDDELSGRMNKNIDSLKRRQRNVQGLRDYDEAYSRWKQNDNKIKQAQSDYDNMSSFNPKKWLNKRPSDGPQAPVKPTWEPNENGEYDGYFSHQNPRDYDNDINAIRDRQKGYRDAKNRYFNR